MAHDDEIPQALSPLLEELVTTLDQTLSQALRALEAGQEQAFHDAVHAAKGMAMTFGLHSLAGEAARLEGLFDRPDLARAAVERLSRLAARLTGPEGPARRETHRTEKDKPRP